MTAPFCTSCLACLGEDARVYLSMGRSHCALDSTIAQLRSAVRVWRVGGKRVLWVVMEAARLAVCGLCAIADIFHDEAMFWLSCLLNHHR